jgi:hypothetical protein
MLPYFDSQGIITSDEVSSSGIDNPQIKLGKPHPFTILKAIYPDLEVKELSTPHGKLPISGTRGVM